MTIEELVEQLIIIKVQYGNIDIAIKCDSNAYPNDPCNIIHIEVDEDEETGEYTAIIHGQ